MNALAEDIRRDDARRETIMDSLTRRHPDLRGPTLLAVHERPWLWNMSELQVVVFREPTIEGTSNEPS